MVPFRTNLHAISHPSSMFTFSNTQYSYLHPIRHLSFLNPLKLIPTHVYAHASTLHTHFLPSFLSLPFHTHFITLHSSHTIPPLFIIPIPSLMHAVHAYFLHDTSLPIAPLIHHAWLPLDIPRPLKPILIYTHTSAQLLNIRMPVPMFLSLHHPFFLIPPNPSPPTFVRWITYYGSHSVSTVAGWHVKNMDVWQLEVLEKALGWQGLQGIAWVSDGMW